MQKIIIALLISTSLAYCTSDSTAANKTTTNRAALKEEFGSIVSSCGDCGDDHKPQVENN